MKSLMYSIFILTFATPFVAFGESESELFDFRKTLAIYHLLDDGAIIYVRPEGYSESQAFIRIYETLDNYLAELEQHEIDISINPDDLPLVDELMFLNWKTQKLYRLKEGWLGDGNRWVPITASDYNKVKATLEVRKNRDESKTGKKDLSDFTKRINGRSQDIMAADYDDHFSVSNEGDLESEDRDNANKPAKQNDHVVVVDRQENKGGRSINSSNEAKLPKNVSVNTSPSYRITKIEGLGESGSEFISADEKNEDPRSKLVIVSCFVLFLIGSVLYVRKMRR